LVGLVRCTIGRVSNPDLDIKITILSASFSITFHPDFKGTPLFDVEYLITIQD